MSDRFFVPDGIAADTLTIDGPEAHHLLHVRRARPGDEVELFDGAGVTARGIVLETGRKSAQVNVVDRQEHPRPAGPTLVTAVPKGDRFRWLVEKATELGVARLIPVETDRSVVAPGDRKLEKMIQAAIAACKQCRRNWLPDIAPVTPWAEAVAAIPPGTPAILAHPGGVPLADMALGEADRPPVFLVGPEGGLTDVEVQLARDRGATAAGLGPFILRIETAGMALAAWWRLRHPG